MRCVVFATREFEQQTPWSVTKVFNFIFSISRLELFHARRLYTQWKKIQEETNKVFANIFLLLSDVLGVPTFAGDLCILSLISTWICHDNNDLWGPRLQVCK